MQSRAALTLAAFWFSSIALALPVAAAPQNRSLPPADAAPVREVFDRYCVACHNQRLQTASLALDTLDAANTAAHADVWEKVVRKLRSRVMPPLGVRRPDEATYQTVVDRLERSLDRGAAAHPYPGAPVAHRLNRAEYGNAIRDLLALDVDTALLPPTIGVADNVSDVLNVSPCCRSAIFGGAKISALAVGDSRILRPRAHSDPAGPVAEPACRRAAARYVGGTPSGTFRSTGITFQTSCSEPTWA